MSTDDELQRARERLTIRRRALKAAKAMLAKAQALVKTNTAKVNTTERTVRRLKKQIAAERGVGAAVAEANRHVGKHEDPGRPNRSAFVDMLAGAFTTARGFPWCGAFAGWCLRAAGVQGVTDRVLYVPFIIEDAKACKGPFSGFVNRTAIRKGDLVCMDFGGSTVTGEHVGVAVSDYDPKTGTVTTIEGNTSPGTGGSQNNGGGVYRRTRQVNVIVGGARPRYPR